MSALGHKQTYAMQQAMSALHPIATESEIPQKAMSALPLKADMCIATPHVRFGPKADIGITCTYGGGAICLRPASTLPRTTRIERSKFRADLGYECTGRSPLGVPCRHIFRRRSALGENCLNSDAAADQFERCVCAHRPRTDLPAQQIDSSLQAASSAARYQEMSL